MSLLDHVTSHLASRGWAWQVDDDGDAVHLYYVGESGSWTCIAMVAEAEGFIIFYSCAPFEASPARRAATVELIAQLNWGLAIGGFEIDLDTGEIRFRTSVDVDGLEVDDRLIANLINANLAIMDQHFDDLAAAATG